MKITPKQYIQILRVLIKKYPEDTAMISKKFIFILRRNHHLGLFSKIKRLYWEYQEKDQITETARLQTAYTFSPKEQSDLEKKIQAVRKNPKMNIVWEENRLLGGGAQIHFGEKGYDESIARRFRVLKTYMK
ncbi:MAG: F0F1 ATP synthase subunit delta [Candidatus Moraniibacteriota bacterium]|nr:MAG: F0F1 ATP synthase subunit delta [Candidatus Moranbacteria bacterium]